MVEKRLGRDKSRDKILTLNAQVVDFAIDTSLINASI